MSNPDSFIDEVTDEVRRDKLFALFRRYGWIGVVLVVLVVGGAAYVEWTKSRAATQARAFGDAVMGALQTQDPAARASALREITAPGGAGAILHLLTAADAVAAKDIAAAVQALDAVVADASLPVSYRDLAGLKRLMVAGDTIAIADRIAAAEALAVAGRPYRPLAMEQLALLHLEQGEVQTAIKVLRDVLQEPQTSSGQRNRVSQLMVALGADPQAPQDAG